MAIFVASWQRELKDRAARLIRCCPQTTAMRLDDRTADRQSHAHAIALGRVESVEDVFQVRPVQSGAGIADGQKHTVRFVCGRADTQISLSVADGSYSFDTIDDQIQDYLLHLDSIGPDERNGIRKLSPQRSAILSGFPSC